jgi:hypothetical protein
MPGHQAFKAARGKIAPAPHEHGQKFGRKAQKLERGVNTRPAADRQGVAPSRAG